MSASAAAGAAPLPLEGVTFKYGMPIYGLAWPLGETVYVCGGGGNGIKNRLVCAESRRGQLTDQVSEFQFGGDVPMRLLLHPNGKSLVLAMGNGGIRRVDQDTKGRAPRFTAVTGDLEELLSSIKGEVNCMAFRGAGTQLALGFSSGELHVYDWPSMKLRLKRSGDKALSASVRDLDFSPVSAGSSSGSAGALLAVALETGVCEVWDWEKEELVCNLEPGKLKQKMERTISIKAAGHTVLQQLPTGTERVQVAKVRFSLDAPHQLLTLLNSPGGAHLGRWALAPPAPAPAPASGSSGADPAGGPCPLRLVSCKRVSEFPCTCFEVSRDGAWLGFGTSEGGVLVTSSSSLQVLRKVPKAHMVFTTGVCFSPSSRALLSVSADASARVTDFTRAAAAAAAGGGQGAGGWSRVVKLVIIFLAILLTVALQAVRVLKDRGMSMEEIKDWLRAALGLRLGKDEL